VRIIVTGVAGFIGSHLAEKLCEMGHSVVGIDNLSGYYDERLKLANLEQVRDRGVTVELRDLATDDLDDCLAGAEAIFHLAAQPGLSTAVPFDDYLRNNVIATSRLLDAARALASIDLFVHCSTSSVYGRIANATEDAAPAPISDYGVTKLAAEQLVLSRFLQTGFPCCSLRLYSVFGPRERPEKMFNKLIQSLLNSRPFPLCEGSDEHRRAFTFVSDAVDAFVACLARRERIVGQIINIGSDQVVSVRDAITAAEEIVGAKAILAQVPARPGDQLATSAQIDKARELLNFCPRVSLHDGIRAQVAWQWECQSGAVRDGAHRATAVASSP
jgi:UDP-glucuronate 4-epimerase